MTEVLHRLNTEHKFTTVYFPRGNSHALLKRCMSKYVDMLNEQWDKCLNLATYVFNILPSCDNSSSPYFLVFGKEPLDAELRELDTSLFRFKLWFEMTSTTQGDLESSH